MKRLSRLVLNGLFGLLLVTACAFVDQPVVPTPVLSATPQVTVERKSLPTPMPRGQTAVYDDLQVEMREAEITTSYLTEYGTNREPPAGMKTIWIQVLLKNVGIEGQSLPPPEHFSVLDGASEFKATYGHRQDHTDYMALTNVLSPAQEVDAWLRFDIPDHTELQDLLFAFLPESTQISFGFSSSEYFWGDHPIYLWVCAP